MRGQPITRFARGELLEMRAWLRGQPNKRLKLAARVD